MNQIKLDIRKRCSKCNRLRKAKFFQKDIRYRLGIKSWCTDCYTDYGREPQQKLKKKLRWQKYIANPKNREYERKRAKKKYIKFRKAIRDRTLRKLYGVSLKQFEKSKFCYLCQRELKLVPDHNHRTGKYRGALCRFCNMLLGWIENSKFLNRISDYLKRGL